MSVLRSIARICNTFSANGIAPPETAGTKSGITAGNGVREDVEDEFADVVMDSPTLFDGDDDGAAIVVGG